jgi:arginine decarboxylase
MKKELLQSMTKEKPILMGCRVPKDFFIASGIGQSDITIHAGSYHLALKDAGIEMCNIMTYSSILPAIATEIPRPEKLVHGSVMETIMATCSSDKGQVATVGIIFGWLYDRITGEKYGGLVCEYNGHDSEDFAVKSLKSSLNELYTNGFEEKFELGEVKIISRSFAPKKKFGTAIVALCFTNYVFPQIE